jgi:magnesium chelatase family protein
LLLAGRGGFVIEPHPRAAAVLDGDPRTAFPKLDRYRDRLSRALLDRFDLVVALPRPRAAELAARRGEPSARVQKRVVEARRRLAEAPPAASRGAQELLARAVDRLPLSGRGRARVARVARSIAALAGADCVAAEHVAEALSYRSPTELSTP